MKDPSFFTRKDTTPQMRADDMELESLLQRAADFLGSRRSPTDQQGPGTRITRQRDVIPKK
jgi:hypothetical protein